jgi:hypothetical protein
MSDADELMAEAEYCRNIAREADPLTMRILLEVAEQYEAEARLLLAYPNGYRPSSRWMHCGNATRI